MKLRYLPFLFAWMFLAFLYTLTQDYRIAQAADALEDILDQKLS